MNVFLYTKLLATATLGAHIFVPIFLLSQYSGISSLKKLTTPIQNLLHRYGLWCALAVATLSTASPLIYTYAYHFVPCTLCWYQRIFMFPLIIILFLMIKRKDIRNKIYVYTLSIIGAAISVYHYINQQLYTRYHIATTDCDAIGMSGSCSEHYFMEFGYITIPLMALTGFILIIFCTYFAHKSDNKQ